MGDILWDEMVQICSTALQWQDIGEEDVIQDIIVCGMDQVVCFWHQEEVCHIAQQPEVVYETKEVVEYHPIVVPETAEWYRYDSRYISPIWETPYM